MIYFIRHYPDGWSIQPPGREEYAVRQSWIVEVGSLSKWQHRLKRVQQPPEIVIITAER
jgi:hypothetical protein